MLFCSIIAYPNHLLNLFPIMVVMIKRPLHWLVDWFLHDESVDLKYVNALSKFFVSTRKSCILKLTSSFVAFHVETSGHQALKGWPLAPPHSQEYFTKTKSNSRFVHLTTLQYALEKVMKK